MKRSKHWLPLLLMMAVLFLAACEALRAHRPIGDIEEYQMLLVGRLDAEYVGADRCLESCHYHDKHVDDLDNSTMGQQGVSSEGHHLVDCESCHGPGSLAITGIDKARVEEDAANGIETACNFRTLTPIAKLPPGAQNLMCMNCHSSNANRNLRDWAGSSHGMGDVTCIDCHPTHDGPDMLVPFRRQSEMCLGCHEEYLAKIDLPSRHPLTEKKMACTSCHEPHGAGGAEDHLIAPTVKETCGSCHAEKNAPFAFAHADVAEDCETCHDSHGSQNEDLLVATEPFLCLQCHLGHMVGSASGPSSLESKGALYTRCSSCHSSLHGSNLPSPSGDGTFIR